MGRRDPQVPRHVEDVLRPHVVDQPHRHGVQRMDQRVLESDLAVESFAVILRLPGALIRPFFRIFYLHVKEMICGHQPGFERRGIHDGFEARTRLAERLGRTVELTLRKIVPAHHGENLAGFRVHAHDGTLALQPLHCLFSGFLHLQVKGRVDLHPAGVHKIGPVLRQQLVEQDM